VGRAELGVKPVVLLYHDVVRSEERDEVGFPGSLAARYKLEPAVFEAHLDAIARTGRNVGLPSQERAPDVVLTFDDGGSSALSAATALEARAWRGVFFVTTSRIGTNGFLSEADIEALAGRGHLIGSHSHSHPTYMGRLPAAQIRQEWGESRSVLGDILGEPPDTASVPGGFVSRDVVREAATAGYRALMTSEPRSGPRLREGLAAYGRYAVWSTTPADRAAAYASGVRTAQLRLWLEWKAKDIVKRGNPSAYQALRRLRARIP
jgi:peptidoglycan/xylan/chitin deacetylase (PgdA/CDA1 family)